MYTTLFDKIKDEGPVRGTGGPLFLFPESFKPTISIHDAVAKGMGRNWSLRNILQPTIDSHLENTVTVKEMMSLYNISRNECGATVYYSCDARSIGGKREDSPFFQLNSVMSKRNFMELENWKEFLFYLLSGLQKIPNVNGRVFRALDQPISQLSNQYRVGQTVVWISFTSTSKDLSIAKQFMDDPNSKGTIMSIDVIEGKDISPFSLFPEKEVLLLPNSSFEVKEITSSHMKNLINIPSSMDGIILIQKQTPPHLLLMKSPGNEADSELRKKWEEYMQKKIEELNNQWEDKLKREQEKYQILQNDRQREQEKYQILENDLKREQVEKQKLQNDLKREQEKYQILESDLKQEQVEKQKLQNDLKREQEKQILQNDLKKEENSKKIIEPEKKYKKLENNFNREQEKYQILQNDLKKEQENSKKIIEPEKKYKKPENNFNRENELKRGQENLKKIQNNFKQELVLENIPSLPKWPPPHVVTSQEIQFGQDFTCQKCSKDYVYYSAFFFGSGYVDGDSSWKKGDTVDCPVKCGNNFHFN